MRCLQRGLDRLLGRTRWVDLWRSRHSGQHRRSREEPRGRVWVLGLGPVSFPAPGWLPALRRFLCCPGWVFWEHAGTPLSPLMLWIAASPCVGARRAPWAAGRLPYGSWGRALLCCMMNGEKANPCQWPWGLFTAPSMAKGRASLNHCVVTVINTP